MQRTVLTLPLLLLLLFLPGCENGPPWHNGADEAPVRSRDLGPPAAYARRLLFFGPGEPLPTAAIIDVTSLADSVGVRRGVRARLLDGAEWSPLMDAGWELEPMREPWRILPGGDLSMTVSDAGELETLTIQSDPRVRLQPGALLAETSPDAGTQLVLRQATLAVGDETIRGVLLDSQLGRAINPASVPAPYTASDTPSDSDADAPSDSDAPGADTTSVPDPLPGRPTPIARAGAEAFLVNASGFYAVFTASASSDFAWISQGEREDLFRGALLEATEWSAPDEGEPQLPTAWRVNGLESGLAGQLSAEATHPSPLDNLGDLTALGYTLVSGWIERGGVRRDVFGLVRYVR